MKKTLLSLFFISSVGFCQQWGFYLGGSENDGAKISNDLFLPIVNKEKFVTFIDLRQVNYPGNASVTHIGLGIRKEYEQEVVLGINSVFSHTNMNDGPSYNRMSYGLEILTPVIDYRLNFYHGLGEHRTNSSETVSAFIADDQSFKLQVDQTDSYSSALNGVDLMVGNEFDLGKGVNLGVYGGVYNFFKKDYEPITGGQFSLTLSKEIQFKNGKRGEFQFDSLYRFDNTGNSRITAGVGFRLELGKNKTKKRQTRDLTSPLNQQDYVYTSERQEELPSRVTDGMVDIGGYTYNEISMLSNSDDFIDLIENASPGTMVVLNGDNGNFVLGTELLTTNTGQALVGGSTLVLVTDLEGHQAILGLSGSDADLISIGDGGLALGTDSSLINVNHHHLKGLIGSSKNQIVNGSFEDGHDLGNNRWAVFSEIEGWMADLEIINAPIEIQNGDNIGGIGASDGSSKLELDSHDKNGFENSNAHVYQDIETVEGETYRLTLDYSARVEGSDTSGVGVYVDGELVMVLDNDHKGWENQELVFNALGDNTRVEFRAMGDEDTLGGYIDNVRMEHIDI